MSKKGAVTSGKNRRKGKPENIRPYQWKPGQSGNPEGRPRKFITLLSDALREKLKQVHPDVQQTYAEVLADRLVDDAIAGKVPVLAIREIADRTEGKPLQAVKVDGNITTDPAKRFDELIAKAIGQPPEESQS